MAAFIDVDLNVRVGRRGALAETPNARIQSGKMTEASPCGVFLAREGTSLTDTKSLKVLDTATDKILGIGLYLPYQTTDSSGNELQPDRMENYVDDGVVWCICEEAVNFEDDVYARHTANGAGKLQLGAVRNDSDGGSVVAFTVNTAANTSRYEVELDGILFAVTSDSDGTAAEVATALAAAIDAHAAYTVPVPGAAVFTVTKADGTDIVVGSLDSRITAVSSAKCVKVEGAKFASKSTGAGVAKVRVNLPQ